jgi:fumarate reductase subunit C
MTTMKQNPHYTQHHPKWYRVRMPIFWWVYKWVHARFILREITSVAVACYALVLLFQVYTLSRGAEAYENFVTWLKTPAVIVLHAVIFVFVIFHSVTWFNLAPKALVIRIGKKPISGRLIAALNYLTWIIFSIGIAWIILAA